MARRSLPERTVDAWVVAALTSQFPQALIWGPTERELDPNWDYGGSLGDGKLFILEDKATVATRLRGPPVLDTHRIKIDLEQLDWYCDHVEKNSGAPAYYVLPRPPFPGEPSDGVVPGQAMTRLDSPAGPFIHWAFVIRCHSLRQQLCAAPGRTTQVRTDDLPLPGCQSLAEFVESVARCNTPELMRKFGTGGKAAAAASGESPAEYVDADEGRSTSEIGRRLSSAVAVFVPAQDIPGWPGVER